MKHITPNFKPINIPSGLNIHGKKLKPKIFIELKVTWPKVPKETPDSQTRRNPRK